MRINFSGRLVWPMLIQKAAEFLFLSAMLSVFCYVGSRLSLEPTKYGLFFPKVPGVATSIMSGVGFSFALYLFTLYPLVAVALTGFAFGLIGRNGRLMMSLLSAASSAFYIFLWKTMLGMQFNFVYWLMYLAAVLFVCISSFLIVGRRIAP